MERWSVSIFHGVVVGSLRDAQGKAIVRAVADWVSWGEEGRRMRMRGKKMSVVP